MIVKIKSDENYLIRGIRGYLSGGEAQIETVGAYYHEFPP